MSNDPLDEERHIAEMLNRKRGEREFVRQYIEGDAKVLAP